jgi:hypothetical protein
MRLIGYYNERQYQIFDLDSNFEYCAGNSKFDSQGFLEPDNPDAVSLENMRDYCTVTLDNLCIEHKAENLGISYESWRM